MLGYGFWSVEGYGVPYTPTPRGYCKAASRAWSYWQEQTLCPVTGSVTMGLPDSQHCVGPLDEVPPGESAPGTPAEPPGLSDPPPEAGDEPEFVVGWPATNSCNHTKTNKLFYYYLYKFLSYNHDYYVCTLFECFVHFAVKISICWNDIIWVL